MMNRVDINKKELYIQYKNITKTCINDGYLLPHILKSSSIPKEYKLTDKEKQEYFNKTTKETKEKLYNMMKKAEENTKNKSKKEQEEYYNQELKRFISEYPEYENIMKY